MIERFLKILSSWFTPSASPQPIPVNTGTQLKLVRKTHTKYSTEGELSVNGKFLEYTIELPNASLDGSNVCIQPGTYTISQYKSPRWGFVVPLLDTSKIGRTNIEIHPSNWAIQPSTGTIFLEGCIALGRSEGTDYVNNSLDAFKVLMTTIDWTQPVSITITEG